jgi:hypothetical protein
MTQYYVSNSGNDSNDGLSTGTPWASLSKVSGFALNAGDIVSFAKGSSWTGVVTVSRSGASGNPIIFNAYGSGTAPTIANPGSSSNHTHCFDVSGSNITIDGFYFNNCWDSAVRVNGTSVTVQYCEVNNCGVGVETWGQYTKILHNYIHDMHMVVDDGVANNDYGANGCIIHATDAEIAYNQFTNCKHTSTDYTYDGGAIDTFGTADRVNVHHNIATGCLGFFEAGSSGGGSINNATIWNNIVLNCGSAQGPAFMMLHNGGSFPITLSGIVACNNTIVDKQTSPQNWTVIDFMSAPAPGQVVIENNIFYMTNFVFFARLYTGGNITHDHNIYRLNGASYSDNGIGLGPQESDTDPLFVNVSGNDFHLQSSSPARDTGVIIALVTNDYAGTTRPQGSGYDMGAYEWTASGGTTNPNGEGGSMAPAGTIHRRLGKYLSSQV